MEIKVECVRYFYVGLFLVWAWDGFCGCVSFFLGMLLGYFYLEERRGSKFIIELDYDDKETDLRSNNNEQQQKEVNHQYFVSPPLLLLVHHIMLHRPIYNHLPVNYKATDNYLANQIAMDHNLHPTAHLQNF